MLITVCFSSHPISEAMQTLPGILSSSNGRYPDGLQGYAAVMEKEGPGKKMHLVSLYCSAKAGFASVPQPYSK